MKNSLPQGAEALLIALNTPSPNGLTGIPVLLWGRPGVGKSSFIEGLANQQTKVLTLIASIHDPTDFSGLPVHENGKVKYVPPAWMDAFADYEAGILFLDELSTCPPAVQAALLRVVFERRVGFEALPDKVRIVAAANPPDMMVGGWELSPPMRNRFVHLDWDISAALFNKALLSGWELGQLPKIDPKEHAAALPSAKAQIAAFLRVQPALLHGDPSKERYGFCSPRSWEYAAHLMASCAVLGIPNNLDLLKGCLGEGTAVAFAAYLQSLNMPDPEAVLAGAIRPDLAQLNDGEVFVLFAGMERQLLRSDLADNYVNYGQRFLEITQDLNDLGRRDVIFVSLRSLAQQGFLSQLLTQAQLQSHADADAITQQITTLFSDEGLVEFIDVLS